MDLRVYPQSRIAALPRIAQAPAVVVRNFRDIVLNRLVMRGLYGFTYFADGMATTHYSPFMEDEQFSRAYAPMSEWWHTDRTLDVRWRMWVLTRHPRLSAALPGAVVEFGAYRGGCAYMMLSTTPPREGRTPSSCSTHSRESRPAISRVLSRRQVLRAGSPTRRWSMSSKCSGRGPQIFAS